MGGAASCTSVNATSVKRVISCGYLKDVAIPDPPQSPPPTGAAAKLGELSEDEADLVPLPPEWKVEHSKVHNCDYYYLVDGRVLPNGMFSRDETWEDPRKAIGPGPPTGPSIPILNASLEMCQMFEQAAAPLGRQRVEAGIIKIEASMKAGSGILSTITSCGGVLSNSSESLDKTDKAHIEVLAAAFDTYLENVQAAGQAGQSSQDWNMMNRMAVAWAVGTVISKACKVTYRCRTHAAQTPCASAPL